MCPRCGNASDSVMHMTKACVEVNNLWLSLIQLRHWQDFLASPCTTGVLAICPKIWEDWFGFVCWLIWLDRNKLVKRCRGSSAWYYFCGFCQNKGGSLGCYSAARQIVFPCENRDPCWLATSIVGLSEMQYQRFCTGGSVAACGGGFKDATAVQLLGLCRSLGISSVHIEIWDCLYA